jgi:hypothetical protein
MTALGTAPPPTQPPGQEERPRGPMGRTTRWRRAALWALVLAAATALLTVFALGSAPTERDLAPDGTGPNGARALLQVLEDQGVTVEVARSAADVRRLGAGAGTTLVVAGHSSITPTVLASVVGDARSADRVVLVSPGQSHLDALDLPVNVLPGSSVTDVAADCTSSIVEPDDVISSGELRYVIRDEQAGPSAAACFADDAGADGGAADGGDSSAPASAAYLVVLPGTTGPEVDVLGSPEILRNGTITDAGNARVALRLLGQSDRLVWYLPGAVDAASGPAATTDDGVPDWFTPALLGIGTAVVVLALWRGRRLGRLVTEPLPVVVPASETTRSRGRLYRASRDRARATAILRDASIRRLTTLVGLPPGSGVAAVVQAVAHATGTPAKEVGATLAGPPPTDDDTMVGIAGRLEELEERVRGR